MDKISDKDEHVIVHAMREIYGGEVWGGHAFVLNKTTNRVLSEANNDMQENGGKPLDVSFDEAQKCGTYNLMTQACTKNIQSKSSMQNYLRMVLTM